MAAAHVHYRYSRFVRSSRWILPVLIVFALAGLFGYPLLSSYIATDAALPAPTPQQAAPSVEDDIRQARQTTRRPAQSRAERLAQRSDSAMSGVRYSGNTSSGLPYLITATAVDQREQDALAATEDPLQSGEILMREPLADIQLESGAWVAVMADRGRYNARRNVLKLKSNVQVFHDQGYTFQSRTAHVNIRTGIVAAKNRVEIHGPAGHLSARSMTFDTQKKQAVFTGPARLVLWGGDDNAPE